MARMQIVVVDLDAVEKDPVVKAGFEAARLIRRTVDAEQLVAITDEEERRETAPSGDELVRLIALRLLQNPSLAKGASAEPGSCVWNYHLRRTGKTHDEALNEGGLKWLRSLPDKSEAPATPPAPGNELGAEA